MKQLLILLFSSFITLQAFSQSDLLVLKDRNETIQTWVPGSIINFQFSNKQWLQGIIKTIRNDSIIMEQIVIRIVPNQFGFGTVDTAKYGLMKFHVNEIYALPKKDHSSLFTNGALLKVGGAAFIAVNLINSAIHSEPVFSAENATKLGIAAGVFLLGVLLGSMHKTYIILGKRYTMRVL